MNGFSPGRYAVSAGAAAALLVGCGGSQPAISAPGAMLQTPAIGDTSDAHRKTFNYTGGKQSFTVPEGVHSLTVDARGAAGASGCIRSSKVGRGGRVYALIPVTPHQRLVVYVGGNDYYLSEYAGGFNGGARPNGGGASDVRTGPGELRDRIIVAGGGGGQGPGESLSKYDQFGCGGSGGGLIGGNGTAGLDYGGAGAGGSGGTQSAGGAGGSGGKRSGYCKKPGHPGRDGKRGVGGAGAASNGAGPGGGGGGGYFGGGGGGGGCPDDFNSNGGGGGGGGSAYAEPSAKQVHIWENWKDATGYGLVTLSW